MALDNARSAKVVYCTRSCGRNNALGTGRRCNKLSWWGRGRGRGRSLREGHGASCTHGSFACCNVLLPLPQLLLTLFLSLQLRLRGRQESNTHMGSFQSSNIVGPIATHESCPPCCSQGAQHQLLLIWRDPGKDLRRQPSSVKPQCDGNAFKQCAGPISNELSI